RAGRRRAARRSRRPHAGDDGRVRQGASPVRRPDRLVPGREAPSGRRRARARVLSPLVYRGAWSIAHADDGRSVHVAMAKARASEAALRAGRVALQVHGAIGYTTEYDL